MYNDTKYFEDIDSAIGYYSSGQGSHSIYRLYKSIGGFKTTPIHTLINGIRYQGSSQILGTVICGQTLKEEPVGSGVMINKTVVVIGSEGNGNTSIKYVDKDIYPVTGCYDKFGNLILGGMQGRTVVVSPSGAAYYDSNVYTDYLIGDIKEYSTDAKNAALAAESKATEAVELIKGLDTKFTTQLTNIQNQIQPAILSVKTTNGATATKSGSINIVATAINASQYRYRVNNGAFSEWQLLPVININSLAPGVNVIEVQATNSLEEGAPVSSGYITVFRL